ncbi:taste receptor type 2 member 40-like [Mantella aurantiaca]
MRRISEDFLHNSDLKYIILSAVTGRVLSSLSGAHTPNLSMLAPKFISILISALLGLGLAIPSNTCIVIVYLESLRKKGKLSPSDVIFLAKGIVNILLQCFMTLQAISYVFLLKILFIRQLFPFMSSSVYFFTYCNFWLTAWLSAHYCTSITNLSYGIFIWIKGIVSNYLSHILVMMSLGIFIVSVPGTWNVNTESIIQSSENESESSFIRVYNIHSYFVPANVLGCILPFCLSLLCLVLTFSFLVRHVWGVKNNDSGSTRPNLQAHVTALRTIFFLLLICTFLFMSQVITAFPVSIELFPLITIVSWNLRLLTSSAEAAVLFQASNKLKKIIMRIFWTGCLGKTKT